MGHHFREQEDFASKQGATRRSLLKGVLVGAAAGAAGIPAFADASGEIPQLTQNGPKRDLQHWLDTADPYWVAQYHARRLADAMGRLDPAHAYSFRVNPEKGFAFIVIDETRSRVPWSGNGFYELVYSGERRGIFHVVQAWDEAEQCWGYWAARLWDGRLVAGRAYFTEYALHIVRRIDGVTERNGRWIVA